MKRRGFTLVELLVVVAIILVLMGLIGGAVSAARVSQKKQSTQALIEKLDAIIQQQYETYASRAILSATTASLRAEALRKIVSGDMPDNWDDVAVLKSGTAKLLTSGTTTFPLNAAQRAYVGYYNAISPSSEYGDAECLFMTVMAGGIVDCLDCSSLSVSEKGDKDGDKAPEFLDAWGNPIRFVLWPAGLELPPSSGIKFFSSTAPFSSGSVAYAPGGIMRPLLFSAGPDGKGTLGIAAASHIATGTNCGNPASAVVLTFAAFSPPSDDATDRRSDNITNFDDEAKR